MFRTALISMFLTSTALADTWTVDDDGKADFDNIQAAVDASSNGDEIVVMPGTYMSTQDGHVVNMLGKAVTLRSSDPGDPDVVAATIINGENTRRGIACFNGETNKTLIEGLTITNCFGVKFDYDGSGGIDWWEESGGGMLNTYSSSPTLTDCTFENNTAASAGGGMYNTYYSSPTLINCTFENNTANNGGGMLNYDCSPTLTGCTFTDNSASVGGGMVGYLHSDSTLTDCTFTGNTAETAGGGMASMNSSPTLTNCTFTGNTAETAGGGGMLNDYNSSPTLADCTFTSNTANNGAGMYNYFDSNSSSSPTLTNTTVCGNTPDQIYGDWTDKGGNTIADECPPIDCPDINDDGLVNVTDLLAVIDQWGLTNSPADVTGDGVVNVSDVLLIISNWGPCE